MSEAASHEKLAKQWAAWAFAGWMMTGVILGIAALIGSRLLFDLPQVAKPQDMLIWLISFPVAGGVVFSGVFLVLAKRQPAAVRVGLYLVYVISFMLAALVLGCRLLT